MGYSVFPAPAAGKTRYVTTLTSGTSWTVPAGVTYVNVTLIGGGGGAGADSTNRSIDGGVGAVITSNVSTTPGASITYAIGAGGAGGSTGNNGGAGGTTTFTGATSAAGGNAGQRNPGTSAVQSAGGVQNNGFNSNSGNTGGSGAAGAVEIEYWI